MSRLKQRLDTAGSTLFAMTWNEKATPSGRSVCLLRASGHRTSGSGCGSWLSPTACSPNSLRGSGQDPEKRKSGGHAVNLQDQVLLASWRSPAAQNADRGGQDATARTDAGHTLNLQDQVTLASWPTPNVPNGGRSVDIQTMDATGRTADGKKHTASLEHAAKFTSWPTPTAQDNDQVAGEYATNGTTLGGASRLSSWATPTTRDHKDGDSESCQNVPINSLLGRQIHLSGSPAETAKPGQLNPRFSGFLMGYPPSWDMCAMKVESRTSRRSSPKPPTG